MINYKKLFLYLYFIALSAIIALFLFTDLGEIWVLLSNINVKLLIPLVLLQLVTIFLINWQWRLVSLSNGKLISWRKLLYINMVGTFVESITPALKTGSELTRIYLLKSHAGLSLTSSSTMVILQKSISFFSFISLNIIGLIFFLVFYLNRAADKTFFAANLLLLTLLLILLITFFVSDNMAINFLKVLPLIPEHYKAKAQSFLASLRLTFFNLLKDTRLFIFLVIQAYVIWLLYAVKAYIVAQSFGIDISFAEITVVTLFSYMIAMIPLSPGGLGSFEAAYAFMFTSMGFDIELGITSALILRFVTFWFVFSISTLYLGLYKLTCNIRKIKILSRQFKEQNEIGYENEL